MLVWMNDELFVNNNSYVKRVELIGPVEATFPSALSVEPLDPKLCTPTPLDEPVLAA
jgi:hypothetical protein